jgi:hypothetical protein
VYLDLVLCDLDGKIVANGKPQLFHSLGQSVEHAEWFRAAKHTQHGDQFGFETAHRSPLVNQQSVLAYSCGVRKKGQARGELLGVLGILFNWDEFAQTIMEQTPLNEAEKSITRCCICDDQGRLLADSRGRQLSDVLELEDQAKIFAEPKNYTTSPYEGKNCCVAHAQAPGFETYSTGWHSLVVQEL